MSDKKILFITTQNLATNPRLVKELRLVTQHGFKATVLFFHLGNWSDSLDADVRASFKNVHFIPLSATRSPFLPWIVGTALQKFFRKLPATTLSPYMISIAVGKRSFILMRAIKRLEESFNWVIGHNPGAFYPAFWAAKNKSCFLGIDVEDYHPGESGDLKLSFITKSLMKFVLPHAHYCSYAAPLFAAEVKKDIPLIGNQQIILLNGFEKSEFKNPVVPDTDTLQLVWFSQNINFKRGLEYIIPVVNKLYPRVSLHLVGKLDPLFKNECLKNESGIEIHAPKMQKDLHGFLAKCDIGLACDIPVDKNRELAITNKIIAYAQAGLLIVASKTTAQVDFLTKSQLNFRFVDDAQSAYMEIFEQLIIEKSEIRKGKDGQYQQGRKYDWELISKPLLTILSK